MKRSFKTCFSLLMALCILISLCPAVFAALPPYPDAFSDVTAADWYYGSILWAKENGITSGLSPDAFAPNKSCTRAQVVTFLWAANGRPQIPAKDTPFKDVSPSDWYYKAVLWAVENGITGGTSPNTFSPDADCTRAQIVTFLYAAKEKPSVTGSNTFADVANDAWYAKPVIWAVENEVTKGIGDGKFGPDQPCTRAQVVTFLSKVYGKNTGHIPLPTIRPIPIPTPVPSIIPVPAPITPKPIIK